MYDINIIVVDEVHTAAGKTLQEMCDFLDEKIAQYIKILDQVTTEAAKAGHTTARYQEYAGLVSGLQGQLGRMGMVLNSVTAQYVSDIDDADRYLY